MVQPGGQFLRRGAGVGVELGANSVGGQVELLDILLEHAPRAEAPGQRLDGALHDLDPRLGHAVVAGVVGGQQLVLQGLVERDGVGLVLRLLVGIGAALADGPAVLAVVALRPPAVEHAPVGHAVQRRLLAAGAAGLAGAGRVVEPDVHPLVEEARRLHVVVFDEDHLARELRRAGQAVDLLDERLARLVGRVRLAGEDELHGPPGLGHQVVEARQVAHKQRGPLVGGEAAREADGQRVGVEHTLGLGQRARPLAHPLAVLDRLAPRVVHHAVLQLTVDVPQLLVGHLVHLRPQPRVVQVGVPIVAQVLPIQLIHRLGQPGCGVDAVGDGRDGHLGGGQPRPQVGPHGARDLAVEGAHAVVEGR